MAHWHDHNPWADRLIYVPDLEELAACVAGGSVDTIHGVKPYTVEYVVNGWRQYGKRLDAYILPQPDGRHSIGIRYGANGEEYLSPYCANLELANKLIEKYS